MMSGITDLSTLLASLRPSLDDEAWVYCTVDSAVYGDLRELEPLASFGEDEGLTLVVPRRRAAEAGLPWEGPFRRITLTVHSSLAAVGLTAAVAAALTARGISANLLAAFHHDHLLVPAARAEEAMSALRDLSRQAGASP